MRLALFLAVGMALVAGTSSPTAAQLPDPSRNLSDGPFPGAFMTKDVEDSHLASLRLSTACARVGGGAFGVEEGGRERLRVASLRLLAASVGVRPSAWNLDVRGPRRARLAGSASPGSKSHGTPAFRFTGGALCPEHPLRSLTGIPE